MKHQRIGLVGLALLLVVVPVVGAGGFFKVGEPAPTFSLTSITGQTLSLQDLRGRVVVLGLFHICEPCRIQSTNLQKVHEATRGHNVSVVGVNSSGDAQADVREFLDTFPVNVTYPYLTDPERVHGYLVRRRPVHSKRVRAGSGRRHSVATRRQHGAGGFIRPSLKSSTACWPAGESTPSTASIGL